MFCGKVKEFLSHKGVKFIERDVMKDNDALNELKSMGIMTTPVTVIDGEKIIGYDTEKLGQLLGK
jgi:glutaredoxin